MADSTDRLRLILGVKLKQLRQERGFKENYKDDTAKVVQGIRTQEAEVKEIT